MKSPKIDKQTRIEAFRGFILTFMLGSFVNGCISSFLLLLASLHSAETFFANNILIKILPFLISWPILSIEAAVACIFLTFPLYFFSAVLVATFILFQGKLGLIQAIISGATGSLIYFSYTTVGEYKKTMLNVLNGTIDGNGISLLAGIMLVPAIAWGIARITKDETVMGCKTKPAST